MPKSPEEPRVFFPHKGATDRTAYAETPGDSAPYGTIRNVRPAGAIAGGRFIGGQRPGLRQKTDAAGVAWGRIGNGPIQNIIGMSVTPPAGVLMPGDRESTHDIAWSRVDQGNDSNVFILGGLTAVPYQVQAMVAPNAAVTMTGGREVTSIAWSGDTKLFAAVNQTTFTPVSVGENYLIDTVLDRTTTGNVDGFYGTSTDGSAPDGYTRQNDSTISTYTDTPYPDIAFQGDSVNGQSPVCAQQPAERVVCATIDGVDYVFAAVTRKATVDPPITSDRDMGYIGVYVASTRNWVGANGRVLLPSAAVVGGSHAVSGFEGSYETRDIKIVTVNDSPWLYFCYRAGIHSESAIGRIGLLLIDTIGLTQDVIDNPGSGVFTCDGGTFGSGAESVNFPRGNWPTAVAVDPDTGFVYYTSASAGYGWDAADPEHYPDADAAVPINVHAVDPTPTSITYGFLWESVCDYNAVLENPIARATTPELICCEFDDGVVFVAGRTVRTNGKNVFGLDAATGGRIWDWFSSTSYNAAIFDIKVDPTDHNLIVTGERSTTWKGVAAAAPANTWKIDRNDGTTLWGRDVGVGRTGLSLALHSTGSIIAVGTTFIIALTFFFTGPRTRPSTTSDPASQPIHSTCHSAPWATPSAPTPSPGSRLFM